jgi:hypothetical protein
MWLLQGRGVFGFSLLQTQPAKSWNAKLTQVEALHKDPLELRHRTFVVQAFLNFTGLSLDDLYEYKIEVVGDAPAGASQCLSNFRILPVSRS